MGEAGKAMVVEGTVTGPFFKEKMVCQFNDVLKPMSGVIRGDNPLDYAFPLLLLQISLIFLSTRLVYFLLKPFKQSSLSAQILTGILLGPSVLGYYFPATGIVFPPGGRVVLNVIADVGAMLHLFTLSLQMDATIIKQAGAAESLLAATGFICPISVGWFLFMMMMKSVDKMEEDVASIPVIMIVNSLSSFPVITGLLYDLKLLNSELGRFASRISMINDFSCFIVGQIMAVREAFVNESSDMGFKYIICFSFLMLSIFYLLRPFIIWITRCTKYGHPMEDSHFFFIMVSVFLCSLGSEFLGQHYLFGPFVLGAVLPDGPPLGSEIEQKLHVMSDGLLVPIFCVIAGLNTDIFAEKTADSHSLLKVLVASIYVVKFSSFVLPALCCGLQLSDALCLALILCSKGIVEVAIYGSWKDAKTLNPHSFNILMISLVIITGVSRPIICYLYDPEKKYRTSKRRTVRGSNYHSQLRVLACVHNAENVPIIMNLLKACDPTRYSPVTVFVLHLMKLAGRASAVLVPHHQMTNNNLKDTGNSSLQIFNAFERLENGCKGNILVQHFTAIAPYKTMHTDICTIALEKRTTIVIIPFHKQWSINGTTETISASIRTVNHNVMDMAPCTVGLLIDRGQMGGIPFSLSKHFSIRRIAIFFFGGDDDGEALAISGRIASHPDACLTLVLFKHESCDHQETERTINHWIDDQPSEDFKRKLQIEEVTVSDGEETIKAIHSFGDAFDLAIAGRHQDPDSPISLGLTEWSECPELGVIGDMLSSSDFRFSVLVVTQQPLTEGNFCYIKTPSSKSLTSIPSSSTSLIDDNWKPIVHCT